MTSAGTGIIIEQTDSELLIVTNNHVVADSSQLTVTFDDQSSVEADIKGTDPAHDLIIEQTDSELLIVTNNHVVADSSQLTVTFDDQSSVEADIKGTDPAHDLAVIAVQLDNISDETMDKIAVATLGDSTKLKVGEPAIAIGNALGYGQSVTTGVISAKDRESRTTDAATGQTTESSDVKLIQTDAAINPGNSGGALVNANGEVIGINSAKLIGSDVEGIGYAIPISDVSDIITNLMNQETKTKVSEAERGYLGITGLDVEEADSQRYGMPTGVYISEVSRRGGAENAGITKGSIIVGFNGITIDSMDSLQEQLQYYKKGETVTLTLQVPQEGGEYKEQTVEVIGFNGITIDSMDSLQEQLQYYKKGETVTLTLQVPQEGGEYKEQTVEVILGNKTQ